MEKESVLMWKDIWDLVGDSIGLGGDICDTDDSGAGAPGCVVLSPWEGIESAGTPPIPGGSPSPN